MLRRDFVVAEGQRELGGAEREIDFRVVGKSKLKADTESGHVREGAVALVAEDVRLVVHARNLARGASSDQRKLRTGNLDAVDTGGSYDGGYPFDQLRNLIER